jgi:glycosyltransferase involved in cell wall biosynthesis
LRIVHVVIGGDVAGGQLVALRLAQAARERGDVVSFVAPRGGPFVDRARADGFEVALLDIGRSYRLDSMVRLARLLRSQHADVLHTHTLAAANVLGRIAARIARARVVSHLHIENHFRPVTQFVLAPLDNVTARLAAKLVAVSEDTRQAYERQGYPRRIEVVYNGVPLEVEAAGDGVRAELQIAEEAPLVATVGRLCDVKGQRELIEAISRLPAARAVLVGADLETGGRYETELRRHASDLGVADRVIFAGYRPDAERIVAAADVVALPSWTEGLPLVLIEAMVRRRPVVATPVGGTPEVVADGETGLLVPPRDPQALADALERLLADPALRDRMGDAGYARAAQRFSVDEMTRRMLEIYDEAVG